MLKGISIILLIICIPIITWWYQNKDARLSPVTKSQDTYTLITTGDVILARAVNATMVRKNDFNYPFEKTADFLKNADITFINLESPLIPNCPVTSEGMRFCGDERAVSGLVFAGVDVATLANNHSGNYGVEGIDNTNNLLAKNGIKTAPAIIDVRGKKFGFLGYNDIGEEIDKEHLVIDIKNLKADFKIVAFHWGVEYTDKPNQRQIELAHLAVDSGADLIIGNHPHWVQPTENYKGKLIVYAHGNYVFDQMWSQKTREGIVGRYVFNDRGLIDSKFYPVLIEDFSQPHFTETAGQDG